MFDLHSHILFGVDDGSKSLDQSVEMIKVANSIGFTDILATPHFIGNTEFNSNVTTNNELLHRLRTELTNHDLPVELYLGNECFLETDLVENLKDRNVTTLNNTSYALLEVPRNKTMLSSLLHFIFELQLSGYCVILAHPERYDFVIDDMDTLGELIKRDVLIQLNLPSLIGVYGQSIQKVAHNMIESNMVHLIGSDAHNEKGYERAGKSLDILRGLVNKNKFRELTETNPRAIVEGNILYPEAPIKIEKKKSFWHFLKLNRA